MIQLDMFEEYSEVDMLRFELEHDRVAAVKRYREIGRKMDGMGKEILKLHEELERLREKLIK